MYFDHHFIGMHWIWWTIMAILIFLVIFNVIPYRSRAETNENALDILKKRFARGEIEREEFEEQKKILEQTKQTLI